MLDVQLSAQLQAYLERVRVPFEITASLDDSESAREMRDLLEQIAALSDKITLRLDGAAQRKPSFSLRRSDDEQARIEFAAIPLGHEFTSLVLALLQVGGHPPKIEAEQIEQIKALDGDFHFETYMSLSCHNCPDVVQALNLLAVLNPRIRHTTIDGALFQAEVEAREIMAVPTIFLNGKVFGQGRMGVEEIVAKLDTGAAAARCSQARRQGAVRRADRRRRPGRRGGGDLCRAQGHPHRRRRRALRRPDARYAGDRELHLGAGDRRAEVRDGARAARQDLRRRHDEPAARRGS